MSDPITLLRGALESRYEVLRLVGEGAHGAVLLARDLRHNRSVAIKALKVDPHSEQAELRFMREIKLLACLQHPNILPLFDSGYVGAVAYYVMPYVDGETLAHRIHRLHHLPVENAVAIACELLSALGCAHAAGVVHRDIKPANILLSGDRPLLADFGIALSLHTPPGKQITRTGDVQPGTPAYMSPEQLLGDEAINGRTDLYAVGCVLYEMLLGKPPFAGKDGFARRLAEPPPFLVRDRAEIPVGLERAVRRSLSRPQCDRFATAQEMERALREAVSARQPPSVPEPASRITPRRRAPRAMSLTPARTLALRHNVSSFLGREEEAVIVATLLRESRLVTILGPGGVGKTQMAEHVASEGSDDFGEVYLTTLGGVASPQMLWSVVGESVGVPAGDARDAQSRLISALGKKQVLLVLDGFEHLVQAATSVQSLLEQTPKVRILVTSRERLNVSAEAVFDLGGLTTPTVGERGDPARHAALRLFLDRARHVAPRFTLTSETEPFVSRICQLVGGLPLAIEMAASMLRSLDCADVASELERGVDVLQSTLRDAPLRHRSLRAVFDQSWSLLDSEQRDAMARLSVFTVTFSRDAARVVTGASVHALAALVDKSLLRYTGSDRYHLHEVIRHYARQRLSAEALEAVANAHAEFFGSFVQARAAALTGRQQEATAREIIRELAEVRAGWRHAVDTGQEAVMERYVDGLYRLHLMRGWFREGVAGFESAATSGRETLTTARVLARYGGFLLRVGELTLARDLERKSLGMLRRLRARSEMPLPLRVLAEYATVTGRYAVAGRLLRHAAEISTATGNRTELASTLIHTATALLPLGRHDEAESALRRGIMLLESLGDESTQSVAMTSLGALLVDHDRVDEGEGVLQNALVASRAFGNARITAAALLNLSQVSVKRGDVARALQLAREALDGFQAAGIEEGLVAALRALGDFHLLLGEDDDALQHYQSALQGAKRIGSTRWTMAALVGIAEVFTRRGDHARAAELLDVILHEKATGAPERALATSIAQRLEPTSKPSPGAVRQLLPLDDIVRDTPTPGAP